MILWFTYYYHLPLSTNILLGITVINTLKKRGPDSKGNYIHVRILYIQYNIYNSQ